MGDGTLGEGVVYESLNMASLWSLPVVFVLENNRYAQSTPIHAHLAGEIPARFRAFGIPALECEASTVEAVYDVAREVVTEVRAEKGPGALILHTYRFAPHSKGDDTRDPAEIASYKAKDPLKALETQLDPETLQKILAEVEAEVSQAYQRAEADPVADPASLTLPLDDRR
jgi:TPP-dependent pyruvate/acetoin dehydrogenase alpha subunit